MTVTITELRYDCGEVYDSLTLGTTAAIGLLSKASQVITKITGTTTNYDLAIRSLADAYICQQVLGSTQATDQAISVIRVGRKQIMEMRDNFFNSCDILLQMDGFSLGSYRNMRFIAVNQ